MYLSVLSRSYTVYRGNGAFPLKNYFRRVYVRKVFRDWSKSIGGGGVDRSREGVGHDPGFESCARGGLCNFQLPLGGGSPYFLLTTNETVDYTCYIKHSQLELLLKYSQTCCARKYKG